ncbi:MAG: hypothetical protein QOH41_929 [Blastocatellia bacterium]|nr:hypothetical protein [Blastocatellia bacterium]
MLLIPFLLVLVHRQGTDQLVPPQGFEPRTNRL